MRSDVVDLMGELTIAPGTILVRFVDKDLHSRFRTLKLKRSLQYFGLFLLLLLGRRMGINAGLCAGIQ